jgi:hypothetical protein
MEQAGGVVHLYNYSQTHTLSLCIQREEREKIWWDPVGVMRVWLLFSFYLLYVAHMLRTFSGDSWGMVYSISAYIAQETTIQVKDILCLWVSTGVAHLTIPPCAVRKQRDGCHFSGKGSK